MDLLPSPAAPAAVAPGRIRNRRDFLAANRGARIVTPAFILLVHPNGTGEARFGFTASRKLGNAVKRNRARRRLKEMARLGIGDAALQSCDHVLIARPQTVERPFALMLADARDAVRRAAARLEQRA